ncbi:ABC transporter ATP-binding protein [Treponema sp. HNW]|uniref:ABC transporter ATP-binding protein n=1 Tax=Treponema sp. HNW TaxID=3116654 RepID=UPI003D0D36DD
MKTQVFNSKSSDVVLKDITKIFPAWHGKKDTIAVDNISLQINDGEMVTLLGPSGCGKTTTLRIISGFEYPTKGELFIGGRNVALTPPNKRDVSMVFQSYALFPHLCVWENVAYGLKVKKIPKSEIKQAVLQILDLMELNGLENRFPNQLSGGQQQRVALARATVIQPSVLLFDEPLSNLDAKLREYMRSELRSLQKRLGITSLYVTHDQSEAMAISDRIVIMRDGKIEQTGTPQEIYEHPNSRFIANFIGRANFIKATAIKREKNIETVRVMDKVMHIPIESHIKINDGSECYISFRPEAVRFTNDSSYGIKGIITKAVYFGSRIEYDGRFNGENITIEISNPPLSQRYKPGDTVYMEIHNQCIRVLAD